MHPYRLEAGAPTLLRDLGLAPSKVQMRVASGTLEPTIFPFLRHLMQHAGHLGFIFVGTHRLEALSSDYWSIFFNIALPTEPIACI